MSNWIDSIDTENTIVSQYLHKTSQIFSISAILSEIIVIHRYRAHLSN